MTCLESHLFFHRGMSRRELKQYLIFKTLFWTRVNPFQFIYSNVIIFMHVFMFSNILIVSCIDLQLEDGFMKGFENMEKGLDEKID